MRRALQVKPSVSGAIRWFAMTAQLTAEITLLPPGESPRKGALRGEWFGCPVEVAGAMYDARLFLQTRDLALGSTGVVEMSFLCPELVLHKLAVGSEFKLWERGEIGHGRVVRIHGAL